MVNGQKEFETLKAQLEAEGYTVHSKEHYYDEGEVKRYSAKILAAKWFPIDEKTTPPKKQSAKAKTQSAEAKKAKAKK